MSAPNGDPIQNEQNQQHYNAAGSTGGELPQWARQQISEANAEAGNKRVALRDMTSERDNLKGQLDTANNDKATSLARAETAEKKLMRYEVALAAGVPGDRLATVVERLQGTTEDELKADAAKLVADFGIAAPSNVRATDHSQGHGSETPAVPNTAEAQFSQMWADHFKNRT